ncbi:U4/U5/U6 small nuclear ribonucleoprotein prp3 [Vermiconidia calcicola]|uniref:U4/U5/U6 small nuclear ribonucleoprotein prp3 n=1 Tax=Vermiconidia calcicola TaxID=1690605 RepID=A0ACC3MTM3_9PEZI|nr:U4/U5/U6 small nuclear ribonucleoprotein prp3 [Vermiconidia calcicola]
MTGKRPLEPDGNSSNDAKRIRSNNGSPAAAPPASQNGETEMERKKREAAERMAAVKARLAASKAGGGGSIPAQSASAQAPPPTNGAATDVEAKKAEAHRKIAEMKARMAAKRGEVNTSSPVNGGVGLPSPSQQPKQPSGMEARMAEVRARAIQLSKQRNIEPVTTQPSAPPPRQDGRGAKGGLGVGLHPSLMADSGPTTAQGKGGKAAQQGPKFSTTKGNQQPEAPKVNPYLPAEDEGEQSKREPDSSYDPTLVTRKSERKSKQLVFNQKGKFMAQANALRQQARLEEMKRRIAAETRKVEIEEASDKAFLVPAPPEVEWWDENLLPSNQNSYENCLEDPTRNKIEGEDSIITNLVQHPIILQAPQDKLIPAPKPLMLTQQEQKKLRRQRRMADMKEEQAKIRLGLVEPPAPKVKKSNMMRVLGEQAVKDPTAVEARVNREIAARATDHSRANEERKLTKEQREEKLKTQQAGDEARGVRVAVFKVNDLSSGKHRYQVDVNAKQNALTGLVVLHPTMNLIIVEGGTHSINNYKKLMLNRIKWGENTMPLSTTPPTTFTHVYASSSSNTGAMAGTGANVAAPAETGSKAASWVNPLTEDGELKDLSENNCVLVWEGEEQARSFKRWGSRAVETDGEARDVLGRCGMENMWTLGRSK